MIKVSADMYNGYITIAGHAGQGPKGQDIVCAAVSAIADTLQCAAERSPAPHEIQDGGDIMLIQGTGEKWLEALICAVHALTRIQKAYPLNVEVVVHG
jgi:uncharacterized protein YsxB (DUF464 family)